jgi:hypothetical protein
MIYDFNMIFPDFVCSIWFSEMLRLKQTKIKNGVLSITRSASMNQNLSDEFSRLKNLQTKTYGIENRSRMNVEVITPAATTMMSLNENYSTPRQAAMHVSYLLAQQAKLAVFEPKITGSSKDQFLQLFSMHESIPAGGKLTFLTTELRAHHLSEDLQPIYDDLFDMVNGAFWRSCQLVLLRTLQAAVPEGCIVTPVRRPEYSHHEASAFAYDVCISNDKDIFSGKNQLSEKELILLNKYARKIIKQKQPFETYRLSMGDKEELASNLKNKTDSSEFDHRSALINDFSTNHSEENYDAMSLLVKNGDHLEFFEENEALIPDAGGIYHFSVTNMTKIGVNENGDVIARIQGVGLPEQTNAEIFRMLERKAREFVPIDLVDTVDLASVAGNVELGPLYKTLEKETKYFNTMSHHLVKKYLEPN